MDLCTFSVVSVGGKEGLAGQTLDSFTSCIVGSSRTTYCLTTPTTLDHSRATHVQSVSVVAWRGRRSLGPKRAICGDEFVVQCWRSQWRTSSSPAAEDTALGVRKWPRCSIVHGFRAVRNAAQRSPCGARRGPWVANARVSWSRPPPRPSTGDHCAFRHRWSSICMPMLHLGMSYWLMPNVTNAVSSRIR